MLSFSALAIGGAVASVAVACRPKTGGIKQLSEQSLVIDYILTKTEREDGHEINLWRNFWNDPFNQLRSLAKGLDDAIDLTKSSTFKPLIESKKHEATFLAEAEKQIKLIKEDIKMYANSPFWKNLREKNTTFAFTVKGSKSDLDIANMNSFGLLQPTEFPLLYSSPDYDELPGLGMKFAPPKNLDSAQLLDSWYSFGWKSSSDSDPNVKARATNRLINGWEKQFDKFLYVYNDGEKTDAFKDELGQSYEQKLIKTPNFTPARLIKGATENLKMIGQSAWSATYGLIGTHYMLRKLSELFGMPKEELDGLKAKEHFKVNQNPTPLFSEDDLETKNGKKVFKEGKSPYKKHRKDGSDINFWATGVHHLDQSITLGVRPNLFIAGRLATSGHDRPTGVNYLIETSGEWIKQLPAFGNTPGTETITSLNKTYLKQIYDLNVNTMTSGVHNLSEDGNIMTKANWGKEYEELLSSIAWTSRRFRDVDRNIPKDKKYTQENTLLGYDQYLKEKQQR